MLQQILSTLRLIEEKMGGISHFSLTVWDDDGNCIERKGDLCISISNLIYVEKEIQKVEWAKLGK